MKNKTAEEILISKVGQLRYSLSGSYDDIIAAMHEYAAQEKWIPLKERKPELGIGVLINIESGYITVAYLKMADDGLMWQCFGDIVTPEGKYDKVTHWQPLPHPPTTES